MNEIHVIALCNSMQCASTAQTAFEKFQSEKISRRKPLSFCIARSPNEIEDKILLAKKDGKEVVVSAFADETILSDFSGVSNALRKTDTRLILMCHNHALNASNSISSKYTQKGVAVETVLSGKESVSHESFWRKNFVQMVPLSKKREVSKDRVHSIL